MHLSIQLRQVFPPPNKPNFDIDIVYSEVPALRQLFKDRLSKNDATLCNSALNYVVGSILFTQDTTPPRDFTGIYLRYTHRLTYLMDAMLNMVRGAVPDSPLLTEIFLIALFYVWSLPQDQRNGELRLGTRRPSIEMAVARLRCFLSVSSYFKFVPENATRHSAEPLYTYLSQALTAQYETGRAPKWRCQNELAQLLYSAVQTLKRLSRSLR